MEWTNDKVEEYGDIFFEVDEEVIKEVRHEGETLWCLGMICFYLLGFLLLIILYNLR